MDEGSGDFGHFSFLDVPEGAGGGGSAEGENWDVTRRGRGIQVALLNNRR